MSSLTGSSCASDTLDSSIPRRLVEPNRAVAMIGEVDYGIVSVGGDGQILETGNARNRAETEYVFPVCEVLG